jgi:hypothetical protein
MSAQIIVGCVLAVLGLIAVMVPESIGSTMKVRGGRSNRTKRFKRT